MEKCKDRLKYPHIFLLILGAGLFISVSLHKCLWFDETYSAVLSSHRFSEMLNIAAQDVHPFLYYIILRIVNFLSHGSIIALRLFSALGMQTLAILGYTHVRKFFSAEMGFFFSLLTYLSAASLKFASEIRMYSWAAVFVFLSALYAYITVKESFSDKKHAVLFIVFSLFAAYTHYYALVTVSIINLLFIIFSLRTKQKISNMLFSAAFEIILYIPGFIVFFCQSSKVVSSEYWIRVKYPDVLTESASYMLTGGTEKNDMFGMNEKLNKFIVIIAALLFVLLIFSCVLRYIASVKSASFNNTSSAALLSVTVFCAVVACGLLVSCFKEFYYVRYTMVMHGLLIFASAAALASLKRQSVKCIFCTLLAAIFLCVSLPFYKTIYDGSYERCRDILCEKISEKDIIVYADFTTASVLSDMIPDTEKYYYRYGKPEYPRADLAFDRDVTAVSSLSDIPGCEGRVWILDSWGADGEFANNVMNTLNCRHITEEVDITTSYRGTRLRFLICDFD